MLASNLSCALEPVEYKFMFEFVPLDVRVIFEFVPLAVIDELLVPEAINVPVVTEPLKVALPELFIVNLLDEFVTSWILKSPLPFFIK